MAKAKNEVEVPGIGTCVVSRVQYKGHDLIKIEEKEPANPRYPKNVQFGLAKAKLVAAAAEQIASFVADFEQAEAA